MVEASGKNERLLSTHYLLGCKPAIGKSSAGEQKRKWNDVLMGDFKRCDQLANWKETVQDRGAWR